MWPFRKSKSPKNLNNVSQGWIPVVREPFSGAWQKNKEIRPSEVRDFFAIYACTTLIAGDISKMAIESKKLDSDKVWSIIEDDYYRLLNKPNHYQNGVQFRQWWLQSKLKHGNTYVLKKRDGGKVTALYILDPDKVDVMLTDAGQVFYKLKAQGLTGVKGGELLVPASDIIHDRYQPQTHPLVGVSPVYGAALAGALGKQIQQDSYNFFMNGANLSGLLTAPGSISEETAEILSKQWNSEFTGVKAGRVAVVGDGLKFDPIRAKGIDSQLVEQLKLSTEIVCSCFHVHPFKIGMAKPPERPQDANLFYYSDCLQVLIEEFEACLAIGLDVPHGHKIEFNTDDLLRMDKTAIIKMLSDGVGGGISTPNEARFELGYKPLEGGDTVYMQRQNYSIQALAKRDERENPFTIRAQPDLEAVDRTDGVKDVDFELFKRKQIEAIRCQTF